VPGSQPDVVSRQPMPAGKALEVVHPTVRLWDVPAVNPSVAQLHIHFDQSHLSI
jgi:hypothetical protein